MACMQEKCSSNIDDIDTDNSFTAADMEESFILNKLTDSPCTEHHPTMGDDDSNTVAENEASPIPKNQHFHSDPDDNPADGVDDSLPPLPVCTSTPYSGHCQSRLLDSMACLRPEDSGLGCSFASDTSPSAVVSSQINTSYASRLTAATRALSLSDSPALSLLVSSPILMSSADVPCPENVETTSSPAASSPEEEVSQSPLPERESLILSTPLSLPLSGSFTQHNLETLVTSTPVDDADSPAPGQAFQNRRGETPAGDADTSVADPSLCSHRPRSPCKVSWSCVETPPLPTLNCPSLLSLKELEESEVEDEAYFSLTSPPSPQSEEDDWEQSLSVMQRMKRALSPFTPSVPDRLVGRNMGLGQMDIITQLHWCNLPAGGVLAWLTPYLGSADLIRMGAVCRQWRHIILRNKKVTMYRTRSLQIYSSRIITEKENKLYRSKSGDEVLLMTRASACLKNVQATATSPTKRSRSNLKLYEKVRKNLQWEELLRHCPLCHSPAKMGEGQEHAQCQSELCGIVFCTLCLNRYHPTLPCPPPPHPLKDHPGGRKSKKQLRRISNF